MGCGGGWEKKNLVVWKRAHNFGGGGWVYC